MHGFGSKHLGSANPNRISLGAEHFASDASDDSRGESPTERGHRNQLNLLFMGSSQNGASDLTRHPLRFDNRSGLDSMIISLGDPEFDSSAAHEA